MNNQPLYVLIIENHPMMREALTLAVAGEPSFRVAAPESGGVPFVQMVVYLKPDIVFITAKPDIILFGLDGRAQDDLKIMKSLHDFLPDTPILALTSNEFPGEEEAALASGAQAVLTKSVPREELLRMLHEINPKKPSTQPQRDPEKEGNDLSIS